MRQARKLAKVQRPSPWLFKARTYCARVHAGARPNSSRATSALLIETNLYTRQTPGPQERTTLAARLTCRDRHAASLERHPPTRQFPSLTSCPWRWARGSARIGRRSATQHRAAAVAAGGTRLPHD